MISYAQEKPEACRIDFIPGGRMALSEILLRINMKKDIVPWLFCANPEPAGSIVSGLQ